MCPEGFIARQCGWRGGEGSRGGGRRGYPLHPHCVCDEEFIARHREGVGKGRRGYPTTPPLCVR